MNPAQAETFWSLWDRGYKSVEYSHRTDGCVRVITARKLGKGRMPLDITLDGGIRQVVNKQQRRDRQRSSTT